ncbi:MAG: tetratricopeptide repeat protein [Nostoc indistinguendum CM1-VF10]|nr:tetratricopeptide repeat protein [Nostoc indistinguendum CM1-VF10]
MKIQFDPQFAQAYGNRGIVYNQIGNKQKAIENFQQAVQMFQAQNNTNGYEQAIKLLKQLQR